MLVINSVCGCAAGAARPGVLMALQNSEKKPDHLTTVFAGFDVEATNKAREYTLPYPPSSPAVALPVEDHQVLIINPPDTGTITIFKDCDTCEGESFGFTDDIEEPGAFSIFHREDIRGVDGQVFMDVPLGDYFVTEDDPSPQSFSIND